MGGCSSKTYDNTAEPVPQPEPTSIPADTTAVDTTPDVAPTETPAADAAAARSDVEPEAEAAAAEEHKEEGSVAEAGAAVAGPWLRGCVGGPPQEARGGAHRGVPLEISSLDSRTSKL